MSDRAPQTQDKFVLRLPDGMRDRIKSAAEQSGRSMNAEIVVRLIESFERTSIETEMNAMVIEATDGIRAELEADIADLRQKVYEALSKP